MTAPKEPFTVQAGKRYVRRDGEISGIMRHARHGIFVDMANNEYYYSSGAFSMLRANPEDLISEYQEPRFMDHHERIGYDGEPTAANRLTYSYIDDRFYIDFSRNPDGSKKAQLSYNEYREFVEEIQGVKRPDQEPTADEELICNGDFTTDTAWTAMEDKTVNKAGILVDEWGPWIGWNGGECPVDGLVEVAYRHTHSRCIYKPHGLKWNDESDHIIAYRIKKEPEVREDTVWIDMGSGDVHDADRHVIEDESTRQAIITLTNGEPSIRWADE